MNKLTQILETKAGEVAVQAVGGDDVVAGVAGAQHDHGDGGQVRVGLHLGQHLQPAHLRQVEVEQHQIRRGGVAVRTTPGIARGTGSVGEFSWPGAFGTYWWADPSERLAVVWMTASPNSAANARHRQTVKALVNGARSSPRI